jgi:regulatory protein
VAHEPAGTEALAVAMRALARREYSQRGLRERLARAGVAPQDAEEALAELRRTGLLDEGRFAAERARVLADRGRGDAAIRHELEREGLSGDEIDDALGALEPERERAERLVARRGPSAATARLLASRGFDEDVVAATVAPAP